MVQKKFYLVSKGKTKIPNHHYLLNPGKTTTGNKKNVPSQRIKLSCHYATDETLQRTKKYPIVFGTPQKRFRTKNEEFLTKKLTNKKTNR